MVVKGKFMFLNGRENEKNGKVYGNVTALSGNNVMYFSADPSVIKKMESGKEYIGVFNFVTPTYKDKWVMLIDVE